MTSEWEDFEGLGDRCKEAEQVEAGRKALSGTIVIGRFDGRSFSNYTRKFDRPYDERIQRAMLAAVKAIVEDLRPVVGYTQSDEITVVWNKAVPFDGKFQKLASVGAALASVAFNREMEEFRAGIPFDIVKPAIFDGRVWQVANREIALENLWWREADASKNSVSMLARAHFSHKMLQGKSSQEMRLMLEGKGVVWGNSQTHFKRGVFVQRKTFEKTLTDEEWQRIPEGKRPDRDHKFMRSETTVLDTPPLRKLSKEEAMNLLLPEVESEEA